MSGGPLLVVGLGCQRGCPAGTLQALLDQTLLAHGLERHQLCGLASIDLKRDEPGLLELAGLLELPLSCFSAGQLAASEDRLSHRSAIAFQRTGCHGVAESAALALADRLGTAPATLLVSRQKAAGATLALARVS